MSPEEREGNTVNKYWWYGYKRRLMIQNIRGLGEGYRRKAGMMGGGIRDADAGRSGHQFLMDLQRNLPFHAAQTASKRLPLRDESSLNSSNAFWGSSRVSRGMVMASSSSKTVRRSPELMRALGTSATRKVRPLSLDGMKVYTSRYRSHSSCGRDAWTIMTRCWTRATAMEP